MGMVQTAGVMALPPEFRIFGLMRGRESCSEAEALKEAERIRLLDSLARVTVGLESAPTAE